MKKLWIRIGAEIEIPDDFDLTDTKSGKVGQNLLGLETSMKMNILKLK